jgi:hypothetical protein
MPGWISLQAVERLRTPDRVHRDKKANGRVISRLLRQGLTGQGSLATPSSQAETAIALTTGFRPFPAGRLVTNDQVDALRKTEGV